MQFTDPERLVGVLAEGVHDDLVGSGLLGQFKLPFVSGRRQCGDHLSGGGQLHETRLGLGERADQAVCLTVNFIFAVNSFAQ